MCIITAIIPLVSMAAHTEFDFNIFGIILCFFYIKLYYNYGGFSNEVFREGTRRVKENQSLSA